MNVITRGIRNAFRNQVRTFSIVAIVGLSIGLSLAMLVARQAVSDKIASVKSSVGNTVSVSPAGVRGFEGGGTALKTVDLAKLASISHVTSVSQTLNDRLTSESTTLQSAIEAGNLGKRFSSNNGTGFSQDNGAPQFEMRSEDASGNVSRTFTPPVTVIGTTTPTSLSSTAGGGTFSLTSGAAFKGDSTENVALVGKTLATKNNLTVGSTFTAYNATIKVVGIFDSGNDFSNNQVIMPLATLQKLSSQDGAVTAATVTVDSIDNVEAVATAVGKALGDTADVTNSSEQAESSIKPLENIQSITLYSLIGAVVAGAVIILLTMIMIVRERRREIGVIKAIGASNINVMTQFASEAVTFTILGSIFGIILGVLAANPITKMLVNNSTSTASGPSVMSGPGGGGGPRFAGRIGENITNVTASVGWDIILYGLGVAILIAIIGSALASFFIAKVRPAEVMRAE
jgi:putative ABC transport system permease protein